MNPPAPPGTYNPSLLPPSPAPHLPPHEHHDHSQAFYVTSSPNLGHSSHPDFDTHGPYPILQPFSFDDINIPSKIQFFENSLSSSIHNSPLTEFKFTEEGFHDDPNTDNNIDIFNKEVDESLHAGPQSFVDSERVNAGIDDASQVDEETIKNIPVDLWREDIDGIKSDCKKDRTNKS